MKPCYRVLSLLNAENRAVGAYLQTVWPITQYPGTDYLTQLSGSGQDDDPTRVPSQQIDVIRIIDCDVCDIRHIIRDSPQSGQSSTTANS